MKQEAIFNQFTPLQIGEKCPKQAAEKTPVCFANKRPEKCSVYFVKNEKKIMVWTQD